MYRVQIFNNSSWSQWVTVDEVTNRSEAIEIARKYKAKGYETIIEHIN